MPRVIVVQEPLKKERGVVVPRVNYREFERYGEYEFLFGWGELRDEDAMEDTSYFLTRLREQLHDYRDEDYIVLLGNPALCAMAVAIAAECNNGIVTLLDWIRDERRYRKVHIDLNCEPTPGLAPAKTA
jgi:hypothetical protein